ncbi:NAD(P)H-dependent oxidoreductase [Pseudoalteromonas sp. BSi20495]|uniref:NAD(P)H-dependent oxidoreductase n=1 Tax=Pseudoalteromonas sp. BSi20495 TaxID=386429 RepID=UPI0002315C0E|nr:NAD(P)H-dependent oxidoreductase [Pseudoalteromonas sp. BSi20495]GAA78249.1 hypothetical protein P20495_0740 [Pseudoalteromonas sp. BSi20495]
MSNILIVSGHPDLDTESFSNKYIMQQLGNRLPQGSIHYLHQAHKNYEFDIAAEQERLKKVDVIVLQFPMYWYGLPALMKKWLDDVFAHGFAYGSTGSHLQGKKLILSFTSGGPEEDYRYDGEQGYPVNDFLPPFKSLAMYCEMTWGGYVYSGGLLYLPNLSETTKSEMQEVVENHIKRLLNQLNNKE